MIDKETADRVLQEVCVLNEFLDEGKFSASGVLTFLLKSLEKFFLAKGASEKTMLKWRRSLDSVLKDVAKDAGSSVEIKRSFNKESYDAAMELNT